MSLLGKAANFFGLGKQYGQAGGLLNKARNFVTSGLSFMNRPDVKRSVSIASQYMPEVGKLYTDVKKYGNISKNLLDGSAINKKANRFISIERDKPQDPYTKALHLDAPDLGNMF